MTPPDPAAVAPWLRARAAAARWWWVYLAIAVVGGVVLARSVDGRDPFRLAVFVLIPLLALRQAWATAARVGRIDRHLAAYDPALQPGELMSQTTETATFAAGCFWGVEEMFRRVPGVVATRVGYTSGRTENPTYKQVCTDGTGHAEAVEIVYDPSKVGFQQLLELFFENHDPTTLNRQGPDVGTQYRSGVYFHSPEQQRQAEAEIERRQASGDYADAITTEVVPATTFYPAEEYHQKYFMLRGMHHSCHFGNGKRQRAVAGVR